MSRLSERIIIGLLVLFLTGYMGYQIYMSVYGSIKVETVFEYTVSRAISVEGVAIRPEVVIDGSFTGIENYIFEDGMRVTVGENVAEFYESSQSDQNLRRSRELEAEINMLVAAEDSSVNNFSTTEILNRDIKEQLGYLARLSDYGRFSDSPEIRESLTSLINKKQIATGVATNFEARLSTLRAEYDGLQSDTSGSSIVTAKAPVSGFFSKTVDGYEEILTPELLEGSSIDDYLAIIDSSEPKAPGKNIGKIIRSQNWTFVATAPKSSLEFVRPGQEVYLSFETINKKIPAEVTAVMQEKDQDRTVLILACNQVSGELLELRKANAVINFSRYTGLRLNMSDVRFLDEKRGVYVVDNNTVRFKLIDAIYEEQSFILSRPLPPNSTEDEYVNLFDQVVTKGSVYDGKVIL